MLQKIPYYYKRMEMYDNIVSDFSLEDIEVKLKHLSNHWFIFLNDVLLLLLLFV